MSLYTTQAHAASAYRRRSLRRRLMAGLRDTWVLVREFRAGLVWFVLLLVIGALLWRALWNASQPEPMRFIEALFTMLSMIFLNPIIDFPEQWYLDLFFFVMPLLGLVAIGRGLADFAVLLFNRRSRRGQWEEAVASTYRNHIILIGLGHLGIRVARELVLLDEDVVVIELRSTSPTLDEIKTYNIPAIQGDARNLEILRQAGLDVASAVIICTNDDLANLQIAGRVREQRPDVRLVMRLFDDTFARVMAERFQVDAVMSASMMAAPAFAGAATGTEITQTFRVADRTLTMAHIEIQPGSRLDGTTVREVMDTLDISVILARSGDTVDVNPPRDMVLRGGDLIAVVAELPRIREPARRWNTPVRS